MTRLRLWQVDAFSPRPFGGNPAAVCPLERWLDDATMQAVAAENNLAETAFFAPEGEGYRLRWFTPVREVDLCGHATLASGWVVLNALAPDRDSVTFATRSGPLTVRRAGARLAMELPARPAGAAAPEPGLLESFGDAPREVLGARDWLLVYDRAEQVRKLRADWSRLGKLQRFGVIVTAPGDDGFDFVSRFFAVAEGFEDPVTGSAHCTLAPYWAARLGKMRLRAFQASRRGGELACTLAGERVVLEGDCALYLQGEIVL